MRTAMEERVRRRGSGRQMTMEDWWRKEEEESRSWEKNESRMVRRGENGQSQPEE